MVSLPHWRHVHARQLQKQLAWLLLWRSLARGFTACTACMCWQVAQFILFGHGRRGRVTSRGAQPFFYSGTRARIYASNDRIRTYVLSRAILLIVHALWSPQCDFHASPLPPPKRILFRLVGFCELLQWSLMCTASMVREALQVVEYLYWPFPMNCFKSCVIALITGTSWFSYHMEFSAFSN